MLYGYMLGALGLGAILGSVLVRRVQARWGLISAAAAGGLPAGAGPDRHAVGRLPCPAAVRRLLDRRAGHLQHHGADAGAGLGQGALAGAVPDRHFRRAGGRLVHVGPFRRHAGRVGRAGRRRRHVGPDGAAAVPLAPARAGGRAVADARRQRRAGPASRRLRHRARRGAGGGAIPDPERQAARADRRRPSAAPDAAAQRRAAVAAVPRPEREGCGARSSGRKLDAVPAHAGSHDAGRQDGAGRRARAARRRRGAGSVAQRQLRR